MKPAVSAWLNQLSPVPGVPGMGVYSPDKTQLSRSFSDRFPTAALDHSWRTVSDTIHVLLMQKIPVQEVRWDFELAQLYCRRREDGLIFCLFSLRDAAQLDEASIHQLMDEFARMQF